MDDILTRPLVINMMAVLPEHQGEGLGRKLIEALLGEAQGRNMNVAVASAQGKSICQVGV